MCWGYTTGLLLRGSNFVEFCDNVQNVSELSTLNCSYWLLARAFYVTLNETRSGYGCTDGRAVSLVSSRASYRHHALFSFNRRGPCYPHLLDEAS